MGLGGPRCTLGFSTTASTNLSTQLERHCAAMDAAFSQGHAEYLTGLARLHDAIDSAFADDPAAAKGQLNVGLRHLGASSDQLTRLGDPLVRLRADLFDNRDLDASEPLLAREPFFASLDYDSLYRELAGQGAALPHRAFWDEVASRVRDGGARGGFRLLDRHVRELQSDLQSLIGQVAAAGKLTGRAVGEALHDMAIPTARVLTGFTRLLTTFGYVSFLCERAMLAYEDSVSHAAAAAAS
jgi:hypothetical protein